MLEYQKNKTAFVTGAAGFIGYHISKKLLDEGWRVVGIDCMSDYYDVSLKQRRESMLLQGVSYRSVHQKVESRNVLMELFEAERPAIVIHLAAQAGVRYSIENPRAYLESNIKGTFELLEAARAYPPEHMLLASTSSAYGANEDMPHKETAKADHQMSFYAATKKSTENMAHSYAHLFALPITMFRFFTVYGPWGRPDMALFKFTKSILNGDPIDVYNHGDMSRDFTYIDDIVLGIIRVIDKPATGDRQWKGDASSSSAPYKVYNIGNNNPVRLMDFIEEIEKKLGTKIKKNMMEIQPGDVPQTSACVEDLVNDMDYKPSTSISHGIGEFVDWYLDFYDEEKK